MSTGIRDFIYQNNNGEAALEPRIVSPTAVYKFFCEMSDVDKIFDEIILIYDQGNTELAKCLWLLMYFSDNPKYFGRHDIFDRIRLLLSDGMSEDLCAFASYAYSELGDEYLSMQEKESWARELGGWGCALHK